MFPDGLKAHMAPKALCRTIRSPSGHPTYLHPWPPGSACAAGPGRIRLAGTSDLDG